MSDEKKQQAFDLLLEACKSALNEAENGNGSLPTPIIRKLYEAIEASIGSGCRCSPERGPLSGAEAYT